MALLANGLLPASFRGAPFAVLNNDTGGGRRQAVHQYPGRDAPWAEDMGRAARRFRFQGFIVDNDVVFAGGPVQLQRSLLLAALEKAGSGTLTHPTLGLLNVSVTQFSLSEDLGASSFSTLSIEFVESGKQSFASLLSTASGLISAANFAAVALVVDGLRVLKIATSTGGTRDQVAAAAAIGTAQVTSLAGDATALHRLTAQLPGNLGRFVGGGNTGLSGKRPTVYTAATSVADLVASASAARSAVGSAAALVSSTVPTTDLSSATDLAAAIVAMVDALAAACADPADAIRLLLALIADAPAQAASTGTPGVAVTGMVKRSAAAALVLAVGDYQPTSADDAVARILAIGAALDDLATLAADAGDDASYKALRAARAAIVADLRARGASLASITSFTSARPTPALALAQRLYRDPTRATQLVTQADPVHPLFMPTSFEALAA